MVKNSFFYSQINDLISHHSKLLQSVIMKVINFFSFGCSQIMKRGMIVSILLLVVGVSWSKTIVRGKIDELQSSQVVRLAYFTNRIDYEEHSISTKITEKGFFFFEFDFSSNQFIFSFKLICMFTY